MPEINNNYFIIKRPRLAGSKYTSTRRNTSSQPDTARCSSFIRRGTGIDQARLLVGDAPRSRKKPPPPPLSPSSELIRIVRDSRLKKSRGSERSRKKDEVKDGEKFGERGRRDSLIAAVRVHRLEGCSDFCPKSVDPREIRPVEAVKRASRRNLRPVYTHKAIIYLTLSCNTL